MSEPFETTVRGAKTTTTAGPAPAEQGSGRATSLKQQARGMDFADGADLFTIFKQGSDAQCRVPGPRSPNAPATQSPSVPRRAITPLAAKSETPGDDLCQAPEDLVCDEATAPREVCELPDQGEPHAALTREELVALMEVRGRAHSALLELSTATDAAIDAVRVAQQMAWLNMLEIVGTNPELVLDADEYLDLLNGLAQVRAQKPLPLLEMAPVRKGVGAGLNTLVKGGLELTGTGASTTAKIARVLSKGLGGFVVGVLGSLVFDAVVALLRPSTEALRAASVSNAMAAATSATEAIEGTADRSKAAWKEKSSELSAMVNETYDLSTLEALVHWLTATQTQLPKAPNVEALKFSLLERWTLQHAGDDEGAAEGTNSESWKNAASQLDAEEDRTKEQRGSQWKREDGRIVKPDLFADQLRLHLTMYGLDPAPLIDAVQKANLRERYPSVRHRYEHAKDLEQWGQSARRRWGGPSVIALGTRPFMPTALVTASVRKGKGGVYVNGLDFLVTNNAGQKVGDWSHPI